MSVCELCVYIAKKGQNMVPGPLELKLWMVVKHCELRIKPGSSVRATSALIYSHLCSSLQMAHFCPSILI